MYFTNNKLHKLERFMKEIPNFCSNECIENLESKELPMRYISEKHKETFTKVLEKINKNNKSLLSAVYLLTSDNRLWSIAKNNITNKSIQFENIKIRNNTEETYTIFCASKDLLLETEYLSISQLAETNLISPKVFTLIYNAMLIRRIGLNVLED